MNCKYCNKEYLSLNALKQHECRCKNNPNRLIINHKGWPKGKRREKSSTKGTICITNGYKEKYIELRIMLQALGILGIIFLGSFGFAVLLDRFFEDK